MTRESFVVFALWFLLMSLLFLPEWIKYWKVVVATSLSIIVATLYIKMDFDNFMFWVAITSMVFFAIVLSGLVWAGIDLIKMELKNKKLKKQQPKELTVEEWFDVQRAKK